MVIIGILAAFAYPSYQQYTMRSNRADAVTALHELAVSQEQYLSLNGRYSNDVNILGAPLSANGLYQLKAVHGRISALDCTEAGDESKQQQYTLMAIPVVGKAQAKDTDCKCLYVDDMGNKQATGNHPLRCWK